MSVDWESMIYRFYFCFCCQWFQIKWLINENITLKLTIRFFTLTRESRLPTVCKDIFLSADLVRLGTLIQIVDSQNFLFDRWCENSPSQVTYSSLFRISVVLGYMVSDYYLCQASSWCSSFQGYLKDTQIDQLAKLLACVQGTKFGWQPQLGYDIETLMVNFSTTSYKHGLRDRPTLLHQQSSDPDPYRISPEPPILHSYLFCFKFLLTFAVFSTFKRTDQIRFPFNESGLGSSQLIEGLIWKSLLIRFSLGIHPTHFMNQVLEVSLSPVEAHVLVWIISLGNHRLMIGLGTSSFYHAMPLPLC